MKVRASIIHSVVWGVLAVAACSTASDSDPALEARIERVVSGPNVRQSVSESVPAETWTLEERMAHYRGRRAPAWPLAYPV